MPTAALRPLLLVAVVAIAACKEPPQAVPVPLDPPVHVDDETAETIVETTKALLEAKPEPIAANDAAQAVDATALHGTWRIRHTIHATNGEKSAPSEPLAPTRWELRPDGVLKVDGPMQIDGRYVYTGKTLVISALGPKATYTVDALTQSELRVTGTIEAGTVKLENTIVLDREK